MLMGKGDRCGSSCGGLVENGGLCWPREVLKGCVILLLLHARARGDNCTTTGAFSEEERFTVLKEELFLLVDDCC